MVVLVNRAKVSTSTTGNGTITLGSAIDGYQGFAEAGVSDGDTVSYVIEDQDGNNGWEIGTGTFTASGTTLSRTVLESSNSGNAITLSGDANVFVTALAEDVVPASGGTFTGDLSVSGSNLDVDGYITGNVTGDLTGDVTGNADTATTLETSRTISLSGDVTGSVAFDGSANADITVVISDDSHNHVIANVDGLQTELDAKLASSSYTASDVLTKIKTVDGSTSGLDADLLDGKHGVHYDDRTINALGSISGTADIDLSSGTNVTATIIGNTTFTVSNLTSGSVNTVTLYLTNAGAYTITWPIGTVFNMTNSPTLPSSGNTIVVLETYNDGTVWAGIQVWRDTA